MRHQKPQYISGIFILYLQYDVGIYLGARVVTGKHGSLT